MVKLKHLPNKINMKEELEKITEIIDSIKAKEKASDDEVEKEMLLRLKDRLEYSISIYSF